MIFDEYAIGDEMLEQVEIFANDEVGIDDGMPNPFEGDQNGPGGGYSPDDNLPPIPGDGMYEGPQGGYEPNNGMYEGPYGEYGGPEGEYQPHGDGGMPPPPPPEGEYQEPPHDGEGMPPPHGEEGMPPPPPPEGEYQEPPHDGETMPPDPDGYVNEFIEPLFEGLEVNEDGTGNWTLPISTDDVNVEDNSFVVTQDMVGEWEGGIPPEATDNGDGTYTINSWPIDSVTDNGDGTVTLNVSIALGASGGEPIDGGGTPPPPPPSDWDGDIKA